jgi:hypothetical protein
MIDGDIKRLERRRRNIIHRGGTILKTGAFPPEGRKAAFESLNAI